MKFSSIFAVVFAAAAAVSATPTPTTNAKRMAVGLPPLPPARRSPAEARTLPSASPVPK
ncbi:hypothetical protein BT96DRAFT_1017379 [Gymnopus androsaceus JB14]|uniref:Uncharacterized protein n=1 Tax=Gymnopus androsaceus JB14 TaxID=1447944 RepID=A0A6A4I061_9AGAR|nr:hypothetical protein BT96DRAFT_1017379 [Gymnopus androsaceus JB14]